MYDCVMWVGGSNVSAFVDKYSMIFRLHII